MPFILFFGRYIYRLLRGIIVSAIIRDHNKDIKTGFHTCHILDLPYTKKNQPEGTLVDTVTRVKFKTFFCLVEKFFSKSRTSAALEFFTTCFYSYSNLLYSLQHIPPIHPAPCPLPTPYIFYPVFSFLFSLGNYKAKMRKKNTFFFFFFKPTNNNNIEQERERKKSN
jgi:hypothetical protein